MGFSGSDVDMGVSVGISVDVEVGGKGVGEIWGSADVGTGVFVLGASPQTLTPEIEVSAGDVFPHVLPF